MPPPTRTPASKWIEAGLRALAQGPDAVRVEVLAKKLGVTKGSFYKQFESRRDLLDRMLDEWERVMIDNVIEQVEAEGPDPAERLRKLISLAGSSEAAAMLGPELSIRDWARRDEDINDRLRRVDNRRMEFMRDLFGASGMKERDVEARCLLAFSLFVGSGFIAADHGARNRADVLDLALRMIEA